MVQVTGFIIIVRNICPLFYICINSIRLLPCTGFTSGNHYPGGL
uniref:Uncharacterized protein n=1 Tax=Anguilla anguilla TaxID=7936 RepID=A0A0E9REE1_ANGAN